MNFEEFKAIVMTIAPGKRWQHVLPAIPEWHRQRFIDSLGKGMKIPQAYNIVMDHRNLADEAFYKMLDSYGS